MAENIIAQLKATLGLDTSGAKSEIKSLVDQAEKYRNSLVDINNLADKTKGVHQRAFSKIDKSVAQSSEIIEHLVHVFDKVQKSMRGENASRSAVVENAKIFKDLMNEIATKKRPVEELIRVLAGMDGRVAGTKLFKKFGESAGPSGKKVAEDFSNALIESLRLTVGSKSKAEFKRLVNDMFKLDPKTVGKFYIISNTINSEMAKVTAGLQTQTQAQINITKKMGVALKNLDSEYKNVSGVRTVIDHLKELHTVEGVTIDSIKTMSNSLNDVVRKQKEFTDSVDKTTEAHKKSTEQERRARTERARYKESTDKSSESQNKSTQSTQRLIDKFNEFRKLMLDTKGDAKAIKSVEDQIRSLDTTAKQMKGLQEVINRLKDIKVEAEKLSSPMGKANKVIDGVRSKNISSLTDNMRNLSSATVLAVGPLSGIGARITALSAIAGRANIAMALLFGTLAGGVAIMGKFMVSMIRVNKELSGALKVLGVLDKGVVYATSSFEFLNKQSDTYGLTLNKLVKPMAKFAFAARGAGLSTREFRNSVSDINAIGGFFHLPTEDIAGISKALEQMLSKGRVFAEELRQQLGDRVPGAARAALEAFRVMTGNSQASMSTFFKEMKKGLVASSEFVPIFTKQLVKMFGITKGQRVDTLVASYSRLSTSFDVFIFKMDKVLGFTKALASGITGLTDIIIAMTSDVEGATTTFQMFIGAVSLISGLKLFQFISKFIKGFSSANKAITKTTKGITILGKALAGLSVAGGAMLTYKSIVGNSDPKKIGEDIAVELGKGINRKGIFDLSKVKLGNIKSTKIYLNKMIKQMNKAFSDGIVLLPDDRFSLIMTRLSSSLKTQISKIEGEFDGLINKYTKNKQKVLLPVTVEGYSNLIESTTKRKKEVLDPYKKQLKSIKRYKNSVEEVVIRMEIFDKKIKESNISLFSFQGIVQALVGNFGKFIIAVGSIITAFQVLSFAGAIAGATKFGAVIAGLTSKFKKLGKVGKYSIVTLLAIGGLTVYSAINSDAKAATKTTIKLNEETAKFIDSFEKTGKYNYAELADLRQRASNQYKANTQLVIAEQLKLNKLTREYDDIKNNGSKNKFFGTLQLKINKTRKELKRLTASSIEVYNSLKATSKLHDDAWRRHGRSLQNVLSKSDKTGQLFSKIISETAKADRELQKLNSTSESVSPAIAKIREESASLTSQFLELGNTSAFAAGEISRLSEAKIDLFRAKNDIKQQSIFDEVAKRADAARKGTLEQYDAQVALNKKVNEYGKIVVDAGNPMFGDAHLMATTNYRKNLQAINAAGKKVGSTLAKTAKVVKTLDDKFKDSVSGSLNSFVDSIADLASKGDLSFESIGQSFKNMAQSIIKDILAMIIKINVVKPLMAGLFGAEGGGSGGGLLSGLFGGGGGGMSLFADGGIVTRDTPFSYNGGKMGKMGEAGPEAILPLKRGSDGKLGVTVGSNEGGKGNTINITLNVKTRDAESFAKSESQMSVMLNRMVSNAGRNL